MRPDGSKDVARLSPLDAKNEAFLFFVKGHLAGLRRSIPRTKYWAIEGSEYHVVS
jgi:hypothetical protein